MKAMKLSTKKILSAITVASAIVMAPGFANADNAAFATANVALAGFAAQGAATSNCGIEGAVFDRVLTTTISNSGSPKDLVLGFSAETSIMTSTSVASKDGGKSTSWASGAIEVCVETVSGDNGGLPNIADPGVITFDKRKQELWAKLGGFNCTANLVTGVVTCDDPEEIGLMLDTTAAHHFNFVAQDRGPGAITVNAYARVVCSKSLDGSGSTDGCGDAEYVAATNSAGVTAAIGHASLVAIEVQASQK